MRHAILPVAAQDDGSPARARHAACVSWTMRETKKNAVSGEVVPADGSNPARCNERGLRHVPAGVRAALRCPEPNRRCRAWQGKRSCALSNAVGGPRFVGLNFSRLYRGRLIEILWPAVAIND